jgi:hypothetical protein
MAGAHTVPVNLSQPRNPFHRRVAGREGRTGQRILSFKAVRSFHPHLPILARARSGNGHSPIAALVGKCVFSARSNVRAQLSVAEILQLNCYSHRSSHFIP